MVKIFSHADDGRGRERFQREARLHVELEHEDILGQIGSGSATVSPSWSRAGCDRGPSGTSCGTARGWAPTTSIGIRIADALAYMHREKRGARRLCPGNVLLDAAEVAYLADFG